MNEKVSKGVEDEERATTRITRDFDCPLTALFEWFNDPKKMAKWFGSPEGAVKEVFEWDPRPGGALRIHDRMEGHVGKTSGTILELVPPERLVFRTVTALDGGGAPWEALQTVTLKELNPRKTRVTVEVEVLAAGSFDGGVTSLLQGFEGGWGQTFDMLRRELRSADHGR